MNPAKQSPRMESDGTLRWYAGDTFSLTFAFSLKDASGNPISVKPTDRIEISFTNEKGTTVAEFESTGTASPTITIDAEKSARFPEGVYGILAKFNSDNVTTLLKNRKVVVE